MFVVGAFFVLEKRKVKKMKKWKLGILVTLTAFLTVVGLFASQTTVKAASKTITVGTTAQTYPNSYRSNGKLTGFDIALTKAVAKKLGYKVKFKVIGDVPALLESVKSGKIDTVANAVTVNAERKKTYQFSNTFAYYAAQVAVPKDSSVKSLKDLEGKTVSATLGSSNIALLKAYDSKIKIKTYDDRNAIFTDANNGTVAGVLNQRQFLQQTIKKQNLNLRIVKGVAGWNNEAYPFQKSSEGTALKKKFNQALKELKADGTISKLSKQYYGEDVTKKSVDD